MTGKKDDDSLAALRQRLPPEERPFLDGLDAEEKDTLLKILEWGGAEETAMSWRRLRAEIAYIRSL